jgi:hypothetical protein
MAIGLDTIVVRNENCPVREVGDGLVILAAAGTATHSLDEVGAFIWRQCDGQHRVADVVEALVAEYDVEPSRAAGDVQAFLNDLFAADLVRAV